MSESTKVICPSEEELGVIVNNIECLRCGLSFRNKSSLRMHDLKVHERQNMEKLQDEATQYHCPVQSCIYALKKQRFFAKMKYLKQHYLKVHAEKKFPCTICLKSFSTNAAKFAHVKICGIQFTCSCSKTFLSYEALLTHAKRLSHTVDEKYKSTSRKTNSKPSPIREINDHQAIKKPVPILPSGVLRSQGDPNISSSVKPNSENVSKPDNQVKDPTLLQKPVTILPKILLPGGIHYIINANSIPKISCTISTQTEELKRTKRTPSPSKSGTGPTGGKPGKRRVSRQTQTGLLSKEKRCESFSMETQTMESTVTLVESLKSRRKRKTSNNSLRKSSPDRIAKEDLGLSVNFTPEVLFPNSPLPLRYDVGLQDFWEDKSTSGTQTSSSKNYLLEDFNDNVTQTDLEVFCSREQNPGISRLASKSTIALMTLEDTSNGYPFSSGTHRISESDPLLIEDTFGERFSSIETQTEQASQSFFDSDTLSRSFALSSNIETQTTEDFENMEQLLYSNTCTQTCDEILPSDLILSNNQTQTSWSTLDDSTVSAETQTKAPISRTNCNAAIGPCRSWFHAQTSHTETQTDLFSIFEDLQ